MLSLMILTQPVVPHPLMVIVEPLLSKKLIPDLPSSPMPGWHSTVTRDSILLSLDPVAHDTAGPQLYSRVRAFEGVNPEMATRRASPWLEKGAELGLGTSDPNNTEWVEVNTVRIRSHYRE